MCTHFGVDKTVLNQDLTWILGNIFSSNRVIDRLNSVDQDVLMHRAGTVSKICNVPVSWGNQGEVPVSGLSGEFGSTCVVDGPNT